MPLHNKTKKSIFSNIGYDTVDKNNEDKPPELTDLTIPKTEKKSPKKQDINKVSCTFHLPKDLRDDLQSLSFVTRMPQNKIVEQAVKSFIRKKGIKLPTRAA